FVIHKIGRERDAGIFRSFKQFVEQGDRFVEPIPITKRSRRVLDRTIAGLALARLLMIHEPDAGSALTTVKTLKEYFAAGRLDIDAERVAIINTLMLDDSLDEPLRKDLESWFEAFRHHLE